MNFNDNSINQNNIRKTVVAIKTALIYIYLVHILHNNSQRELPSSLKKKKSSTFINNNFSQPIDLI